MEYVDVYVIYLPKHKKRKFYEKKLRF